MYGHAQGNCLNVLISIIAWTIIVQHVIVLISSIALSSALGSSLLYSSTDSSPESESSADSASELRLTVLSAPKPKALLPALNDDCLFDECIAKFALNGHSWVHEALRTAADALSDAEPKSTHFGVFLIEFYPNNVACLRVA
ncbi:hypothetical protein ABBQ38_009263 [Trebouxia sp. C0009 RCD-2024]